MIIPNPHYLEKENADVQIVGGTLSTRSQTLANGVYRIKNAANGKYMDTNGGGTTAGTAIVQWDKSEYYGGTTTVNPNQLFKVTYIGTSGGAECYSIRPMTNNEMGVSAPKTTSISTVDIQPMSVTETTTNIYNYQEWIISSYGSYYTIANTYSATRYLSAPSSSTNGLQMIMSFSITSNAQWIFEAYTESIDRMAMVSFSDTLKIGDTFDFDAVMGSSTIGRNGGIIYSVQNTDGSVTDKATINSSTGVLTALKAGTVQIVTTYTNAPWLWIWNVEIDYRYILPLEVVYDGAYSTTYSTTLDSRINNALTTLQNFYIEKFGVLIDYSSPTIFSSYADSCCSSFEWCTHATDDECENSSLYNNGTVSLKSLHHKNISNILCRIPFPDKSETFKLAFIGHNHCISNSGLDGTKVHYLNPYAGQCAYNVGLMIVMEHRGPSIEIKTIVHEFNHFFELDDHYGSGSAISTSEMNEKNGTDAYSEYCIHGEKRNSSDVYTTLVLCDGCRATLEQNITNYINENTN